MTNICHSAHVYRTMHHVGLLKCVRQLEINVPCEWVHIAIPRNLNMLFLAGTGVLKPHLSDPLAQAGNRSYPFEILPVRIAIDVEVGLQDLQLVLGEGCPHSFGFVVLLEPVSFASIITGRSTIEHLRVVRFAEDLIVGQGKLFPGRQLSSATITGKTGKVECMLSGTTHPIRSGNASVASGTLGAIFFCIVTFAVDLLILQKTGRLTVQWCVADATAETSGMPRATAHV